MVQVVWLNKNTSGGYEQAITFGCKEEVGILSYVPVRLLSRTPSRDQFDDLVAAAKSLDLAQYGVKTFTPVQCSSS